MSEPRPYAMIVMAVVGILSTFIYARQPSSPANVVAESSSVATPIYPQQVGGQFPVLAGGGTQPFNPNVPPPSAAAPTQALPVMGRLPQPSATPGEMPGQAPGLVRRFPPPPPPYTGGVQTAVPVMPPPPPPANK